MAPLVVPKIDDETLDRLIELARSHGRSIEDEAREILRGAVLAHPSAREGLGSQIARRFTTIGIDHGIDELRGKEPEPPAFL